MPNTFYAHKQKFKQKCIHVFLCDLYATQDEHTWAPYDLTFTPGNTDNISNKRFAAVRAVVPVVSYGGET